MTNPRKTVRLLISFTVLVFVGLITIGYFIHSRQFPDAILINTTGQPTIGYPSAKVRVVVFEEPKCSSCRNYNNKVFPQIKREFIETNKILYTVVTVSFLPSSLPAADALLCVYHQDPKHPNPELFFAYLDFIYRNQPPEHEDWVTDDKLIEMAHQASPAIQLRQLRVCADKQTYRSQVAKNTEYGRRIMNGRIITPTLYVDGVEVKDLSHANVSKMIRRALVAKGVSS